MNRRDRMKSATAAAREIDQAGGIKLHDSFGQRGAGIRDAGSRRNVAQLAIDPAQCRMWDRHNRAYELLSAENCAGLIESIRSQGQRLPAIVRPITPPEGDVRFEVVAGARRHFAVTYLRAEGHQTEYLVQPVKDLSDEEAFRLADAENRDREDISDFERARDYADALHAYYGGEATKMADAIGMPARQLQRYVAMTKLPDSVVSKIVDPRELNRNQADKMLAAIRRMKPEAVEAAMPEVPAPAKAILAAIQSAQEGGPKKKAAPEVHRLTSSAGALLGTVEVGRNGFTFKLPRQKTADLDAILEDLRAVAERHGSQGE